MHYVCMQGVCRVMLQDATSGGIALQSCRRVTLQGPATLTYTQGQIPYAQGTVLSVSANFLSYTAQVHAPPLCFHCHAHRCCACYQPCMLRH